MVTRHIGGSMEVMNKLGQGRFARLLAPGYEPGPVQALEPAEVVTLYGPKRRIYVPGSRAMYHSVRGLCFLVPYPVERPSADITVLVLSPERSQSWFLVGEFPDLRQPAYLQVWQAGVNPQAQLPVL